MSEMKLVPTRPTDAMVDAYFDTCARQGFRAHINASCAWEAMLSAAPVVSGGGLSGSNRKDDLPICAEDIARVIEPHAWMAKDLNPDWGVISLNRKIMAPKAVEQSLAKANAILALTHQAATPDGSQDPEQRGEDFAEALYGILALHGPPDLDTRERLELGHFLCLATTDWVRARNRAKAPETIAQAGDMLKALG